MAYQRQKKEARQWESPEERTARKAARKAAKRAAKEEAEQKKKEEETKEAERRKDAVKQATDQLFPAHLKQATNGVQEESKRQFEEQIGGFGMDDLD